MLYTTYYDTDYMYLICRDRLIVAFIVGLLFHWFTYHNILYSDVAIVAW